MGDTPLEREEPSLVDRLQQHITTSHVFFSKANDIWLADGIALVLSSARFLASSLGSGWCVQSVAVGVGLWCCSVKTESTCRREPTKIHHSHLLVFLKSNIDSSCFPLAIVIVVVFEIRKEKFEIRKEKFEKRKEKFEKRKEKFEKRKEKREKRKEKREKRKEKREIEMTKKYCVV